MNNDLKYFISEKPIKKNSLINLFNWSLPDLQNIKNVITKTNIAKNAYKYWLQNGEMTFEQLLILKGKTDKELTPLLDADQKIQKFFDKINGTIVYNSWLNNNLTFGVNQTFKIDGIQIDKKTTFDFILSTEKLKEISSDPKYWNHLFNFLFNFKPNFTIKKDSIIPFEGFNDDLESLKKLQDRVTKYKPIIVDKNGKNLTIN